MLRSSIRSMAIVLPVLTSLAGGAIAQSPPAAPKPATPAPAAPKPGAPAAPASPVSPAAPAPAAPVPMLTPGQNLTVMVVDIQALLENSKAAKMVRGQIEEKRAEYTKDISHQEEVLRSERDALQRQQTTMTPDALNRKGREFQQKVNELDRSVQGKRQALEKSNNDAMSKIQQQMLKIIADIAKQRKANMVFQRTDLVLFDQTFDVTDQVMQRLDEQMPVMTVNFVAPVAPAASPAPLPGAPPTKSRRR